MPEKCPEELWNKVWNLIRQKGTDWSHIAVQTKRSEVWLKKYFGKHVNKPNPIYEQPSEYENVKWCRNSQKWMVGSFPGLSYPVTRVSTKKEAGKIADAVRFETGVPGDYAFGEPSATQAKEILSSISNWADKKKKITSAVKAGKSSGASRKRKRDGKKMLEKPVKKKKRAPPVTRVRAPKRKRISVEVESNKEERKRISLKTFEEPTKRAKRTKKKKRTRPRRKIKKQPVYVDSDLQSQSTAETDDSIITSDWKGVHFDCEHRLYVWTFRYNGSTRKGYTQSEMDAAWKINEMCRERDIDMWNPHAEEHREQTDYAVEDCLDKRYTEEKGEEVLVKWLYYPPAWNDWQPIDNLSESAKDGSFSRLEQKLLTQLSLIKIVKFKRINGESYFVVKLKSKNHEMLFKENMLKQYVNAWDSKWKKWIANKKHIKDLQMYMRHHTENVNHQREFPTGPPVRNATSPDLKPAEPPSVEDLDYPPFANVKSRRPLPHIRNYTNSTQTDLEGPASSRNPATRMIRSPPKIQKIPVHSLLDDSDSERDLEDKVVPVHMLGAFDEVGKETAPDPSPDSSSIEEVKDDETEPEYEEPEYEVDKILEERETEKGLQYHVLWKAGDKTWEPLVNIAHLEVFKAFKLKAQHKPPKKRAHRQASERAGEEVWKRTRDNTKQKDQEHVFPNWNRRLDRTQDGRRKYAANSNSWSKAEEEKFWIVLAYHGMDFLKVADHLPRFSRKDVKNKYLFLSKRMDIFAKIDEYKNRGKHWLETQIEAWADSASEDSASETETMSDEEIAPKKKPIKPKIQSKIVKESDKNEEKAKEASKKPIVNERDETPQSKEFDEVGDYSFFISPEDQSMIECPVMNLGMHGANLPKEGKLMDMSLYLEQPEHRMDLRMDMSTIPPDYCSPFYPIFPIFPDENFPNPPKVKTQISMLDKENIYTKENVNTVLALEMFSSTNGRDKFVKDWEYYHFFCSNMDRQNRELFAACIMLRLFQLDKIENLVYFHFRDEEKISFSFPGHWGEIIPVLEGSLYFFDVFGLNILEHNFNVEWRGCPFDFCDLLAPELLDHLIQDPYKYDPDGQYEFNMPALEPDEALCEELK